MKEIEEPTYVLDYRDTLSYAGLATLLLDESGRELEVHVRPEREPTSKSTKAKATSKPARKELYVVVTLKNSQQRFHVSFDEVMLGMIKAHPEIYDRPQTRL